MTDLVRQEIMAQAEWVVVKVGTRVLTNPDGTLNKSRVESIAEQLAHLWKLGKKCVLVSSGAVGAGLGRLGRKQRPTDLAELQAAAAIGQSLLIESYNRALEPHNLFAAQILLTAEDLEDRQRYLNVRNTLFALFESNAIPIINENDTVSVEELKLSFGDNDRLAALVTNLIRAPLLVLLSDIEGVYSGDPHDASSEVLSVITDMDAAQSDLVHDDPHRPGIRLSRGGMSSKLTAVRITTSVGENVVIANGCRPNVLLEILAGEEVGTLFLAEGPLIDSRKRWIGWSRRSPGKTPARPRGLPRRCRRGPQPAFRRNCRRRRGLHQGRRRFYLRRRGGGICPRTVQLHRRRGAADRFASDGPHCRTLGKLSLRRGRALQQPDRAELKQGSVGCAPCIDFGRRIPHSS